MRRRDFLTSTAASLLVLPQWARGAAPSDQIVMGIIGTGGMGGGHVKWFLGHGDVRVDAICDVDDRRAVEKLKWVRPRYKKAAGTSARDFRAGPER